MPIIDAYVSIKITWLAGPSGLVLGRLKEAKANRMSLCPVLFLGGLKADDAGSMDWVARMGVVQINVSVLVSFLCRKV